MAIASAPASPALPVQPARRKSTTRYIALWVVAAAIASLALVAFKAPDSTPAVSTGFAAILVFTTMAAEAIDLRLRHGKSEEVITLIEGAITLNIVFLSPPTALYVTLSGIAAAHMMHRRHPVKIIFNVAQYALSTVAALFTFHLLVGQSSTFGARGIGAITTAMSLFGIINGAAVAGIMSLVEERAFWPLYRAGARLSALTVFGNTAVGLIAAVVWESRPELLALLVAPALTLHLAYKGVVRSDELLEAVAEERDRLGRVVDGASDGIVLLDTAGLVAVWSPAVAALTGIEADQAVGRSVAEVLDARRSDGSYIDPAAPLKTAVPDAADKEVEMTLRHARGGDKVVIARHNVLFDGDGQPTGDVVLLHDVTREREVEGMKDDFLARISHELRTPLTPIKGFAQLLQRKGTEIGPNLTQESLGSIVDRADHMMRLIDDLLLVSKILAGTNGIEHEIRTEFVDVGVLCRKSIENFQITESHRKLDLFIRDDATDVVADPLRVEQIVANLLSNACKYSEKTAPVRVEVHRDPDGVSVAVTDHGRGIPPDQLEYVFDRFHRLENPLTMTTGGMGLGLYIARQLAEAMGGSLQVESTLGRGSTFTLHLPRLRRRIPAAS